MRDISLHLLDLAQNSITAGAKHVTLSLMLSSQGLLTIVLEDDGKGMSEEMQSAVFSPFTTSRTTRRVGLGIPLVTQNARLSGGDVTLKSKENVGTTLTIVFNTASIDCLPLGNLTETMTALIMANPVTPEFSLRVSGEGGSMSFSTEEIKAVMPDVPLNEPDVILWIKNALDEEIEPILGGISQ